MARVIAFDGAPGAGKTTLIHEVSHHFTGVVRISEPRIFGRQEFGIDVDAIHGAQGKAAALGAILAIERARYRAVRAALKEPATSLVIMDKTLHAVLASGLARIRGSKGLKKPFADSAGQERFPGPGGFRSKIIWPDHIIVVRRGAEKRAKGLIKRGYDPEDALITETCDDEYERRFGQLLSRFTFIVPKTDIDNNNGVEAPISEAVSCVERVANKPAPGRVKAVRYLSLSPL